MRTANRHPPPTLSPAEEMGLGPKKTALVLITVVGCVAILFPKILYPMMVGPGKDLNREPSDLLKQERPAHYGEPLHPSMQERGKAIPPHTVPIIERPGQGLPPRAGLVERRAGSPPMGTPGLPGPAQRMAAYQAQVQQKTTGPSSIIMPIYTFLIVAFFVFTIVKLVMKKTKRNEPPPFVSDPVFVEKVFKKAQQQQPDNKLVYTAIQGIIDATNEQLKEIEKDCAENNIEHVSSNGQVGEEKPKAEPKPAAGDETEVPAADGEEAKEDVVVAKKQSPVKSQREIDLEHRLNLLKETMHIRHVENDADSDLKSIYLEGELPHDPQILVSATETETKTERISQYPSVKDVEADDEAVILSGKMTISLISLASNEEEKNGVAEDHTTTNNVA